MKSSGKFFVVILLALALVGIYYYRRTVSHRATPIETSVEPKTIVAFLGAPGSGKGTLAKRAVSDLHFKSVSTGDLCRAEVEAGSEKGKAIASCKPGELIPDDMMIGMVDEWFTKNAGNSPIILDGFPRTKAQAEKLAELLLTKFPAYQFKLVYLQASDEQELVNRMAGRVVCEKCKMVYNRAQLKEGQTVCPQCGGALIQREDDKPEVFTTRLKIFATNKDEIIGFYKTVGIPVEVIEVSHRTPEEIFADFKKAMLQARADVKTSVDAEAAVAVEVPAEAAAQAPAAADAAVQTQEVPAAQPEAALPAAPAAN